MSGLIFTIAFCAVAPFVFVILDGIIIACSSINSSDKLPTSFDYPITKIDSQVKPTYTSTYQKLPKPKAPIGTRDIPFGFLLSDGLVESMFEFLPTGDYY